MHYKTLVPACLLLLATRAIGADQWPEAFTIQCGDTRHKMPYDPSDERGTLVPMFSGEAVRMAPGDLSGAFMGGVGYKLKVVVQDEQLTGSPAALSLTFTCQTRDPDSTKRDNKLTCSSDLRALATVPGFNMITASLPVPRAAMPPQSRTLSTVSIRRQAREETSNSRMFSYYQTVREMFCDYSR